MRLIKISLLRTGSSFAMAWVLAASLVGTLVFSSEANGSSSTTTTVSSTSTTTSSPVTTTTSPATNLFPWPGGDSAALAVPSLSVEAASPNQPRVPIASLTKLMTTWVVLQQLPLTFQQAGRAPP